MTISIATFPHIIAHRGASAQAPENTLAALRKAGELGAQWVEFDVMLTADGVPIIMHDWTLDRTTNGRGPVANQPYATISQLDAGRYFSSQFAGERVPTLKEWLHICREFGLGLNIEIKERACRATAVAEAIHRTLHECWSAELPKPLISSATPECLQAYHALDPAATLGLIREFWPLRCMSLLQRYHCQFLVINAKRVKTKRAMQLRAAGYPILAYTVNDAHQARQLFDMGVAGVFTDDLTLVGSIIHSPVDD